MNWKSLIVESGKRMIGAGLTVDAWGNISVRDPETQLVYVTPSAMQYHTITEDDVVVVDLDGNVVEGFRKPTIETALHLSIYKNRQDINAIVHTHPIYSMVYACQGRDIEMFTDECAQALGDDVRCTNYALPGSQELADECAKAMGDKALACLIHSHGAVCAGANMDTAFKTAKVLEVTAQILTLIESTGNKPVGVSKENIEAMQKFMRESYGQGKK